MRSAARDPRGARAGLPWGLQKVGEGFPKGGVWMPHWRREAALSQEDREVYPGLSPPPGSSRVQSVGAERGDTEAVSETHGRGARPSSRPRASRPNPLGRAAGRRPRRQRSGARLRPPGRGPSTNGEASQSEGSIPAARARASRIPGAAALRGRGQSAARAGQGADPRGVSNPPGGRGAAARGCGLRRGLPGERSPGPGGPGALLFRRDLGGAWGWGGCASQDGHASGGVWGLRAANRGALGDGRGPRMGPWPAEARRGHVLTLASLPPEAESWDGWVGRWTRSCCGQWPPGTAGSADPSSGKQLPSHTHR